MTTALRHQLPVRRIAPRRQQGVVMFVALIVLVIMTLAGLAMLRQLGTGVSIAGNVAFKQNATNVADVGTESAYAWIMAHGLALDSDGIAGTGYFSSWGTSVDPNAFDWPNAPVITDAATGNTVRYVIHRLCELPNTGAKDAGCSAEPGKSLDKSGSVGGFSADPHPYYRITTQVTGPRNTLSYIQVVIVI